MRLRTVERAVLLVAAVATAMSIIAAIVGYINFGTPVKAAGAVLAVGVGYWIYRSWLSQDGLWLPDPWKATVAGLVCVLIAVSLAWTEAKTSPPGRFDFVVAPRHKIVAPESIAPAPLTESRAAPLHGYGDHLIVTCYTRGTDDHAWYRLADGNFMARKDLFPAPLSDGDPPECE